MNTAPNHQTGTAPINGTDIYYETAGNGPALVLIHAGIADSRMWNEQWNAFAQQFSVVRYDMRGFGRTPMREGEYSHRDDLMGLLRFLGIERAALLGCSMGGGMALDFTLEQPQQVTALIVVGSTPGGFTPSVEPPPPAQWDEMIAAYKAGNVERTSELETEIWVAGPQRTPDQVDADIQRRIYEMNLVALRSEMSGSGKAQPLQPPAVERLEAIGCPTLVIYGDLDQVEVIEGSRLMATRIPGVQQTVMSGTAHFPNMEQPAQFNQVVLSFLESAL